MGNLVTTDPVALRSLMNETLFISGCEQILLPEADKNELVIEGQPVKVDRKKPDILGQNNKNYLFLIDDPAHRFFSEVNLEAFAKILAAKQMTLADVAVLNCAHENPMALEVLLDWFNPKYMIFLGADPKWVSVEGLKQNIPATKEGVYSLLTYSFEEMNLQIDKKKIFWSLLKPL